VAAFPFTARMGVCPHCGRDDGIEPLDDVKRRCSHCGARWQGFRDQRTGGPLGIDPLSPIPGTAVAAPRVLPRLHAPDYEAPFDAYVRALARELEANHHKDGRAEWCAQAPGVLVSEVLYHAAKLIYAVRALQRGDGSAEPVLEYAADVGVLAMMAADAAGVLTPAAPPAEVAA
jgi:hypothetical protein